MEESEADSCGFDDRACLGMTKAFVCFSKERSLQSAEMSGRSRFLLFSRRIVMSIACFWAAVKLLGAIILFDSGQITCDSFKSNGLDGEELVAVVAADFRSSVELLEILVCIFEMDEDEEDLIDDGFAGTESNENWLKSNKIITLKAKNIYLMVEMNALELQPALALEAFV